MQASPLKSDAYRAKGSCELVGWSLMNLLVWLTLGGLIGGLLTLLTGIRDVPGVFLYVVVGMVGAMLGGWFISPLLGIGTLDESSFSLPALLISCAGSAILLATMHSFDRGRDQSAGLERSHAGRTHIHTHSKE
jgi:uncharacterized membrane protein YeaQ/YmgE (transglycosylase-associated protein family)